MTNEITKERRDAIRAATNEGRFPNMVLRQGELIALLDMLDAAETKRPTRRPMAWLIEHPENGQSLELSYGSHTDPLTDADSRAGYTATPLYVFDAPDAAEAKMGEPTHWAVHSRFGALIGLWPDRDAAERAQSEDPHRTIRAFYAAPPAAEPVIPTHRHKKRGSEYVLIGYGKMQAVGWWTRQVDHHGAASAADVDMREVAIYRSVDGGELWVRPREEFEDGRFEALSADTARIVASCAVPNGWVLVPRDPTQQMEAAAKAFVRPYHDISEIDWISFVPGDFFRLAYRAMLAAAPSLVSEKEAE